MIILTTIVLLIISYIFNFYKNVRKYPKGPMPLPIVGNLFTFEYYRAQEYVHELSKVYGNVFTVWLPQPYVVITDFALIKEAYQTKGEDFSGRHGGFPENRFMYAPNTGVLFSEGPQWKEQRRISLHVLRDFGMGKNLMEEKVRLSVEQFLAKMETFEEIGKVDFRWPIQVLVANVINEVLYGFTYTYDNCERLMDFVNEMNFQILEMRKSNLLLLARFIPGFTYIPYFGRQVIGQYLESTKKLQQIVKDDVDKAMKTFDATRESDCFVHSYCEKMQKNNDLTYEQLLAVSFDFFLAGAETTTTTLRFAMIFMADNLDIQEKVRQEIYDTVGKEELPSMSDRLSMPYTQATIMEIQRCANIVGFNLHHKTTCDTVLGEHKIPADTMVSGQLFSVLKYSPVYADGTRFNPSRFLDNDGKTLLKAQSEQMIAFSIGKRQCAGESLARAELFLVFTAILSRYRVEPLPGTRVDTSQVNGALITPKPQSLKITRL